jgi:hypothetical protein
MALNIKDVAAWGEQWQSSGEWRAHTVGPVEAAKLAGGYLAFVSALCGWKLQPQQTTGLDIGAGAGHLAAAFAQRGLCMTASEWNDSGIELMRRENPQLATHKLDNGLRPGGVLVLAGSEVMWPHCADYRLLIRTLARDTRLDFVGPEYPEALIARFELGSGSAYRLLAAMLQPLLAFKQRRRGWARINAVVFRKKSAA